MEFKNPWRTATDVPLTSEEFESATASELMFDHSNISRSPASQSTSLLFIERYGASRCPFAAGSATHGHTHRLSVIFVSLFWLFFTSIFWDLGPVGVQRYIRTSPPGICSDSEIVASLRPQGDFTKWMRALARATVRELSSTGQNRAVQEDNAGWSISAGALCILFLKHFHVRFCWTSRTVLLDIPDSARNSFSSD